MLDYQEYGRIEDLKRDHEIANLGQKRNIISALRAKIRRSNPNDIEDRLRFSPVLSVGKLADTLPTNINLPLIFSHASWFN